MLNSKTLKPMTEEELRLGGVIDKVELVSLCTEKR